MPTDRFVSGANPATLRAAIEAIGGFPTSDMIVQYTDVPAIPVVHVMVPSNLSGGQVTALDAAIAGISRANSDSAWPPAGGEGGISDGDKGDITVASSGASWTIDAAAVTFAKIQSVATGSVIGRSTAGTGAVESLSLGSSLSLSGGVLSAVDPWTYVKLGADFTTSSATAVDVTGLDFTPLANTTYLIRGQFLLRTATATVGPRPGCAWPTGCTDGVVAIRSTSAVNAQVLQVGNIAASVLIPVGGLPLTTGSYPANLDATLIVGGTPSGKFKIQLASETALTNVTMRAGSWIGYRTL